MGRAMADPAHPPADPIRVLVSDVSDLFYRQIAELIRAESNMLLVGRVTGRVELLLAVDGGIEVVVIGALRRKPPPGICSHLLSEYPDLKVLVLAEDTGDLDLYWRGIRRKYLGSVSEAALVGRIRELRRLDL
jgi:hypothetical protein